MFACPATTLQGILVGYWEKYLYFYGLKSGHVCSLRCIRAIGLFTVPVPSSPDLLWSLEDLLVVQHAQFFSEKTFCILPLPLLSAGPAIS